MHSKAELDGAMARLPRLTGDQRILRAVGKITDIQGTLYRRNDPIDLEGAATGHAEAALRLMDQARQENDLKIQLTFLELAGYHAVTSLACSARARDLRP